MNNAVIDLLPHSFLLFVMFGAGIFTVLNGPLWLSVRVRVFAVGPEAPVWLHRGVSWVIRLAGIGMLAAWAWVATGALSPALLMWGILAAGLFCLLNGPVWLITRGGVFRRGRDAPAWLERSVIGFIRLVGLGVLLSAFVIGL